MKYILKHNMDRPIKLEDRLLLEKQLQQKYIELEDKYKPKEQDEWKKFNRKLEKAITKISNSFDRKIEIEISSSKDLDSLVSDFGCVTFAPEKDRTVIYVYDLIGENYARNFIRTTEKKEDGSEDQADYNPRIYIAAGIENASGRPKSERSKAIGDATEQLADQTDPAGDEGAGRADGNSEGL